MPVKASRIIGVDWHGLYVVDTGGKTYKCPGDDKPKMCTPYQPVGWINPGDSYLSTNFAPAQSVIPEPVIDVIYYSEGGSRYGGDNQVSLTANGDIWEQSIAYDEYQTDNVLFCLYPIGAIVALIVAILITFRVNRVLNRRQRCSSPAIDQSLIDTSP